MTRCLAVSQNPCDVLLGTSQLQGEGLAGHFSTYVTRDLFHGLLRAETGPGTLQADSGCLWLAAICVYVADTWLPLRKVFGECRCGGGSPGTSVREPGEGMCWEEISWSQLPAASSWWT